MGKTHVTPTMPAIPPLMSLAGTLKKSTNINVNVWQKENTSTMQSKAEEKKDSKLPNLMLRHDFLEVRKM